MAEHTKATSERAEQVRDDARASMRVQSRKGTLEHVLRPHALGADEMVRRHPAIVPLVERILGVVPRVFGYLELWPPAFETYSLVVPAFVDLPLCDAGLGIGPELRSLTAYAASRGHGCGYCAAHSAALGSVFRGPRLHLAQNAAAIDGTVCALPGARERAVVEYAMAVARVPGPIDPAYVGRLRDHFSPEQVDKLALVAVTMGLLNRCLDTLGMVLERPLLELANGTLAQTGWRSDRVYDERFDEALMQADARVPAPPHMGPLALASKLVGALRFESRALRGLPAGRSLDALLQRELGFVPYYMQHFGSQRVRRVLAHLLLRRIASSHGSLSTPLRAAMALACARASDNPTLAAHFAFLGVRASEPASFVRLLSSAGDGPEALALDFAERACRVPHAVDPAMVTQLDRAFAPAQLIELVLTVSIYSALHRLTLTFPCERLEPAVADFVARHGRSLRLAP